MTDASLAAARLVAVRAGTRSMTGSWLFQSVSWDLAARSAQIILAMASTPVVLRSLGPEQYGIAAIATTSMTILAILDGGLLGTLQRQFSRALAGDDVGSPLRLFWTAALLCPTVGLLLTGLTMLTGPALLSLFDIPAALQDDALTYLVLVSLTFPLSFCTDLCAGVLRAGHRWRRLGGIGVSSLATYTTCVVTLGAMGNLTLRTLAVLTVVDAVIRLSLTSQAALTQLRVHTQRYAVSWRPQLLTRDERHDLWRIMRATFLTSLAVSVYTQWDMIIVGLALPLSAVGFYALAARLAGLLRALPMGAVSAFLTEFGRSSSDPMAADALVARTQAAWTPLIAGYALVACAVSPAAVRLIGGIGFESAATACAILVAGLGFNLLTAVLTARLRALGENRAEVAYSWISVALNVPLTVALAKPFGMLGIVAATSAAQIVSSLALIPLARRLSSTGCANFLRDAPLRPLAGLAVGTVPLLGLQIFVGALSLLDAIVLLGTGAFLLTCYLELVEAPRLLRHLAASTMP
jgi:lipopolysaccharide exporter